MLKIKTALARIVVVIFIFTSIMTQYADIYAKSDEKPVAKDRKDKKTEIIVKYKTQDKKDDILKNVKSKTKAKKLIRKKTFSKSKLDIIEVDAQDSVDSIIKELKKNKDIEYAQPNYELTLLSDTMTISNNDILSVYEVGQIIEGQECIPGTAINVLQAWESTKGSPEVVVGVLDTGIDINHKDLKNNIFINTAEISGNGIDDDGNGYIDDVKGWDFVDNDATVDVADEKHGTQVAGIIAAEDNGDGVCGVAPNVKILPLKFISGTTGYTTDAIEAIEYARAMGVKIINCSWGGNIENLALKDAIAGSDITFICAAGNDGSSNAAYPAAFGLPNIISVGAMDTEGMLASFSNYGENVSLVAPGVSIISTTPQNNYGISSGTSMAAGFVTGVAALLKSNQPELTGAQIVSKIKVNVSKNNNLQMAIATGGIVDAYGAVAGTNEASPDEEAGNPENKDLAYGLLLKYDSITQASADEKEELLKYFNIGEDTVIQAENLGYSLGQSVEISKLSKKFGFSVTEIKALMNKFGEVLEVSAELDKYKRFTARYMVNSEKLQTAKSLFLAGNSADKIKSAYIASEVTQLTIQGLLADSNEGNLQSVLLSLSMQLSAEDIAKLASLFLEYNVNKSSLLGYVKQNSMTADQIKAAFTQYERTTLTQYNQQSGEMVNTLSDDAPKPEKYFNAPFSYRANTNENISLNTGSMGYESVDLELPGKNGLDLKLTSRYDSSNSGLYKEGSYVSTSYSYDFLWEYAVLKKEQYYSIFSDGHLVINSEGSELLDSVYSDYNSALNRTTQIRSESPVQLAVHTMKNIFTKPFTAKRTATWRNYGLKSPWEEKTDFVSGYCGSSLRVVMVDGYSGNLTRNYSLDKIISDTGYINVGMQGNRQKWNRNYTSEYTYVGELYKYVDFQYCTDYKRYIPTSVEPFIADISITTNTSYYNKVEPNTYEELHDNLGSGWSFGFSSIENDEGTKYLHTSDGAAYKINITPAAGDSNLEKHPLNDIRLENDNGSYSNGTKSSSYVLIHKDGKKEYFADDGRLLGIQDRFGNTIKFEHTMINGYPVISKITDTANRVVNINYENTATGRKITVISSDNTSVQYILEPIQGYNGDFKLVKKIDQAGRETSFNYSVDSANFSMFNKNYRDTANYYANLREIKYPTGASSKYTYEKTNGNFGVQGSREYYRIKTREDNEGGVSYKKETYKYAGDYTGYGSSSDSENLPASYTYSTTVVDSDNAAACNTFNSKHLRVIQEIRESGTILTDRAEYQYDSNKLPVKVINRKYNKSTGQYMEKVENYTYDTENYGDLTGYWDAQSLRDSSKIPLDNEHKTTITYNPFYHYAVGKTYKKDAATVIREEYVPSSDSRVVEYIRVYENNIQKQQTRNVYDSVGNVIEIQQFKDGWTSYISKKLDYTDNDNTRNHLLDGVYPTRIWTTDLTDADGAMVQARAGNNAGTVDEVLKYDIMGRPVEKQDGMGYSTTYQYDSLGRKTKEINPDGSYKGFTFNDAENSILTRDENGNQLKYYYDGFGNFKKLQDIASGAVLLQKDYDSKFRAVSESDSKSITDYSYNADGSLNRKAVSDFTGKILSAERYEYYYSDSNGQYNKVVKTVEGDGNAPSIVTAVYENKYGQLEKQSRISGGTEYSDTFKYDYLGNKLEEKSARAYMEGWSQAWTAKYEYNYAGKPVKTYNINGDYATVEYDALGRIISATDFKANKSGIAYSTNYTYDNLGRNLVEKVPFEQVAGNIYYTVKKSYYDRNGRVISEKTSVNKPGEAETYSKTTYTYNNRDMLNMVTTFKDDTTPENYTQYWYDLVGNKLRMYTGLSSPLEINGLDVVAAGADSEYSVTKYEYNRFNKLVKLTDPLGKQESYDYDLNGNLTNKVDRNGNSTVMTYDGINRLLTSIVSTQTGDGGSMLSYTYALNGGRLSMSKTENGSTISSGYRYDDLGRLMTETEGSITKQYIYDAANNRKSFTLIQNGVTTLNTTYTYDRMSRLETVSENGVKIATYSYDENGNRQSLTYNTNGDIAVYDYNLANRLKTLTNKKGTTIISQYSYNYYLDGNQAEKSDELGRVTAYTYDGLGRLVSESPSDEASVSYTYDDANNRKTKSVAEESLTSYSYDKNNRLKTEITNLEGLEKITRYTYDDNGNQIRKASETLAAATEGESEKISLSVSGEAAQSKNEEYSHYNGFNQLVKTTVGADTITYAYNADGLRVSKAVNGSITQHVWDGDQMAMELDGAGNVTNKYVRGVNLLFAEDGAGQRKYYLFNGHGDVVKLTGSDGNVVKSYDYDAFGVEKNPDPADTNVFRYCGEYFDKETGTIYLRARYYDPSVGRFTTEDSYWGKDTDPLSLNLYTYCHNDAVNAWDPSGHKIAWHQWDNVFTGAIKGVGDELSLPSIWEIKDAIIGLKDLVSAVTSGDLTAKDLAGIGLDALFGDFIYLKNNWNVFSDDKSYTDATVEEFGLHAGKALTQVIALVAGGAGVATKIKSIISKVNDIKTAIKAAKVSSKVLGAAFKPGGPKIQIGVDPRTLIPTKDLNTLDPVRMKNAVKYAGDNAIIVDKNGVIIQGHHRVADAIKNGRSVDVEVQGY